MRNSNEAEMSLVKPQPGKKVDLADSPVFRFALVAEIQRLAKADPSVTIMVGQGRKEKAGKNKKGGTGAFLFDIAMSNQWYFDQLLHVETGVQPAERRKPLRLMQYTVRFELRYVTHKGIRCQLDRIKSREGISPSMVQVLNCAFEAGLDPEAVLHAEEATLPGKGICPVQYTQGRVTSSLRRSIVQTMAQPLSMQMVCPLI